MRLSRLTKLDINSCVQLFALHYVYQPRALDQFRCAWNCHRLTTEGNASPTQLWASGMLRNMHSQQQATEELFRVPEREFGVDYDGPIPIQNDDIYLPDITHVLNEQQLTEICALINPLQHWGIDLYTHATEIVYQILTRDSR